MISCVHSRTLHLALALPFAMTMLMAAPPKVLGQPFYFQAEDAVLTYDRDTGVGSVDVTFSLGRNGSADPVQGFSMGVVHNGPLITADLSESPALLSHGVDFFDGIYGGVDGFTVGCVVSFQGNNPIVLDVPFPIVVVTYFTVPQQFQQLQEASLDLGFVNSLGSPPVDIAVVTASGETFTPELIPGTLTVEPSAAFVRGDVDSNGVVEGFIDGLFVLNYGLAQGPVPDCLAAADVNDDGVVLPLNDGIYLLTYELLAGPPPAAPGPIECGSDPDLVLEVECESSPCM